MITQEFDLNIIPDSEPVVVHVNRYDYGTGRFIISLYQDGVAYSPSNASAQIQGEKPDGNVFAYNASISGNVVTANVTEQMTAVAGRVPTQIIVTDAYGRSGSFKFIMDVQDSSINESAPVSDTDIPAIIDGAEQQALRAEEAADRAVEAASEAEDSATKAERAKAAVDNEAQNAEAWARGTRGGEDVGEEDEAYHNNSYYYSRQVLAESENAEAWAVGERSGEPVDSTDETYENNSKYYAGKSNTFSVLSGTYAAKSITFANLSGEYASNSEAWATGKREGMDVPASDETHNNNAKYWADQSKFYADFIIPDFIMQDNRLYVQTHNAEFITANNRLYVKVFLAGA